MCLNTQTTHYFAIVSFCRVTKAIPRECCGTNSTCCLTSSSRSFSLVWKYAIASTWKIKRNMSCTNWQNCQNGNIHLKAPFYIWFDHVFFNHSLEHKNMQTVGKKVTLIEPFQYCCSRDNHTYEGRSAHVVLFSPGHAHSSAGFYLLVPWGEDTKRW